VKILVEPSAHHLLNMGDVAMLTVTVRRLSALWPEASIGVIANDADRLATHCPSATYVPADGRRLWLDRPLFGGRLHRSLPTRAARRLKATEQALRRDRPSWAARLIRMRMRLKRESTESIDTFIGWAYGADVVVVVGAGLLTDAFATAALTVLELLETANRRGASTAMFGQGVGPLTDVELKAAARRVLPRLDLICLREAKAGKPLLHALGVSDRIIEVTGDDAVELAYDERPAVPAGTGIGLSLRLARYSDVGDSLAKTVGEIIRDAGARHHAELVSLPISSYPNERDRERIAEALGLALDDTGTDAWSPQSVIGAVQRCRVVVTGSYHAGVFALAQGISVVALANSEYYVGKFVGLADQFDGQCRVVLLDDPELTRSLSGALDEAWYGSDAAAPILIEAARRQVESAQAAYERFKEIVRHRSTSLPEAARGF
jgi:polysaccharide pyruvyl transferase WcaK-like protein